MSSECMEPAWLKKVFVSKPEGRRDIGRPIVEMAG
jgi:hypothetical protein